MKHQEAQSLLPANPIGSVINLLPVFWHHDPAAWFRHAESLFYQFSINSDPVKYDIILQGVETSVLTTVADLVLCNTTHKNYEQLKRRLIVGTIEAEKAKSRHLLLDVELGSRHPSELLYEIKSLSTIKDETFIKEIWLSRLPAPVRGILNVSPGTLSQLAVQADRINHLLALDEQPNLKSVVKELSNCVRELTEAIRQLDFGKGDGERKTEQEPEPEERKEENGLPSSEPLAGRHLDFGPDFDKSTGEKEPEKEPEERKEENGLPPSKPLDNDLNLLCWYHRVYAERAHKCVSPCNFEK